MMTTIQNISFLLAFLIISCADWGEYLSREDSTGFSAVILLLFVWLPLNIFSLCCGIKIIYISIKEKITAIATTIYGANGVNFTDAAEKNIAEIEELGKDMPVCIAKTQYSLSDDASLLGRPENFTVTIREVKISAGAGFVVALAGSIMTMPGLPKVPAANNIDVESDGKITGLF